MATAGAKKRSAGNAPLDEVAEITGRLEALARKRGPLTDEQAREYERGVGQLLRGAAELASRVTGGVPATWSQYVLARSAFDSDSALAEALGVDRSRVARWKQGEAADETNLERLGLLGVAVSLLSGYLERRAIPDWLSGVNAHLGHRRPIDLLLAGRLSEVVAAIEAEKSGAHA